MDNLPISNFKAFWDADNKFGRIELYFTNGQQLHLPNMAADEITVMLSILQFPNTSWHLPTKSLVKA